MNLKTLLKLFFIIIILLITACSNDNKASEPSDNKAKVTPEMNLKSLRLDNFESKKFKYTTMRQIGQGTVNNIKVVIEEYYNQNSKIFNYVLKIDENQMIQKESKSISYKTIKISVGALPQKDKGIFKFSSASPVFLEAEKARFDSKYYYLFENKKSLLKDEFRYELVMVNAMPYTKYKTGEKTFRLIESIPPMGDKEKVGWGVVTE
ncbi:MAG: hypothetical protein K0S51_1211 [Bacillales bacterium]|jgi:hypothetical protein|nr:hypothetical protein [Bacillales bacterium]